MGGFFAGGVQEVMLADRWNGQKWTIRFPPAPKQTRDAMLAGVSCASSSFCSAVGSFDRDGSTPMTLADTFDGSDWMSQPMPHPTKYPVSSHLQDNQLFGVSCVSASDCVAVGVAFGGTLIERWDGMRWTIQPARHHTGGKLSELFGVSCSSASACTAVGRIGGSTFAQEWDGKKWTIQPTPNPPGATYSVLRGVSCASASACTAVGRTDRSTLAEHWNGRKWTIQPTLNPARLENHVLRAVSCPAVNACTAVGGSHSTAQRE